MSDELDLIVNFLYENNIEFFRYFNTMGEVITLRDYDVAISGRYTFDPMKVKINGAICELYSAFWVINAIKELLR